MTKQNKKTPVREFLLGRAVVFSTSWISKHSLDLIKDALKAKGIAVADDTFYVKNKASAAQLEDARAFAKRMSD